MLNQFFEKRRESREKWRERRDLNPQLPDQQKEYFKTDLVP